MIDDLALAFDPKGLAVLNGALALVMYGVALDLRIEDLWALVRDPRAPCVGLLSQCVVLPILAFPVAVAFVSEPSIALGLILVAACPGGNMSNVLTQLARGRLSVSVGMSGASTLAATFTCLLYTSDAADE